MFYCAFLIFKYLTQKMSHCDRNKNEGWRAREEQRRKGRSKARTRLFPLLHVAKTSGCMDLILPFALTFPRESDLESLKRPSLRFTVWCLKTSSIPSHLHLTWRSDAEYTSTEDAAKMKTFFFSVLMLNWGTVITKVNVYRMTQFYVTI